MSGVSRLRVAHLDGVKVGAQRGKPFASCPLVEEMRCASSAKAGPVFRCFAHTLSAPKVC